MYDKEFILLQYNIIKRAKTISNHYEKSKCVHGSSMVDFFTFDIASWYNYRSF